MTLGPPTGEPRLSPRPQRPPGSLPSRRPDRSQRHGWAPPVVLAAAEGQPCRRGSAAAAAAVVTGTAGKGRTEGSSGQPNPGDTRRPAEISQQLPPEVQTPATGNASRDGRLAGPSGWQGGPGGGALPVWGSGGYPPVREPSRSGGPGVTPRCGPPPRPRPAARGYRPAVAAGPWSGR